MYLIGRFAPGKTILWHAGASSVSISGIQLSRGDNAAAVFATVRSDDKATFCKEELGATGAFNTKKTDWVDEVLKATDGKGVDVILDMVGGSYAERNQQALAVEGRLVQIGIMEYGKVTLDLIQMMMRRQTITGSTLRARSVADKAAIARSVGEKVWPLIEAGTVRPVIDRTFPLAEAAED